MKKLRLKSNRTTLENNIPIPAPAAHQSLVKVLLAGICRTDIYASQGKFDLEEVTLGHEFCGEIVQSDRFPEGTKVSAFPFVDCNHCQGCLARNEACLDQHMIGLQEDGAFAQYMVINDCALYALAPSLSLKRGAFLEPLAAALAPIAKLKGREKQRGYLLGRGRIAELAKIILDLHGFENVRMGLGEELHANELDWLVEADPTLINRALSFLRPGALLIVKSRPADLVNIDISLIVKKNIILQGTRYAPFEDAAKLLENPKLAIDALFGRTYALDEFEEAFSSGLQESKKLFFDPHL